MRLLDSDLIPTQHPNSEDLPAGTEDTCVSVLPDVFPTRLPAPLTLRGTTTFVSPLQMSGEDYDGDFDFDLDLEDDDDEEEDEVEEDDDDEEEDDDDDDDDAFPAEEEDDD
jgi:hypothetical protein